MKKIAFITCVSVVLCSCGESAQKNNAATTSATDILKADTIAYTFTTVDKTEMNDKIKDSSDLYRATITYPVIAAGTALADSINKTLITAAFNGKLSAQAFADSFVVRAKDATGGASFNGWSYEANAGVLLNNGKLFVLQTDIASYTGGAHGSYATLCYNFTKDGKQLLWDDIIETGMKDSLVRLNESTLRIENEIPEGQLWEDAGFFVDSSHMPFPAMFALAKNGLTMIYNQYEIAPYVMGIISYTIPYNRLNGLIKKEWLP